MIGFSLVQDRGPRTATQGVLTCPGFWGLGAYQVQTYGLAAGSHSTVSGSRPSSSHIRLERSKGILTCLSTLGSAGLANTPSPPVKVAWAQKYKSFARVICHGV